MEAREIVGLIAVAAVIGVVAYAAIKETDREDERSRLRMRAHANRPRGGFWEEATERDRITALERQLRRETNPEVRRELVKQIGQAA
jgi:hypothetical protein